MKKHAPFMVGRSYRGAYAERREVEPNVLATFRYALDAYGFLVQLNERVSPEVWIKRIQEFYAPSARQIACINAIRLAMGEL
jgi:hypothetical protein